MDGRVRVERAVSWANRGAGKKVQEAECRGIVWGGSAVLKQRTGAFDPGRLIEAVRAIPCQRLATM